MTKKFYIDKMLNKERIWTFFLLGTAFTLPFKLNSNNLFIFGFFISSLLFVKQLKRSGNELFNPYFIVVWLWCLWNFFSLLWTEDLSQGLRAANRLLLYLVLSLSFMLSASMLSLSKVRAVFQYFIYGCFFTIVVCLLNATYNVYDFANVNPFAKINGNFFSYIQFTDFLKIHPIYLAFQLLFGSCLLLYHLLYRSILPFSKLLSVIFIVCFLSVMMMLNSFIMFLNLILVVIFFIFLIRSLKIKLLMLILIAVPVFGFSGFLIEKFKAINIIENVTQTDFSGREFTALNARVAKIHGTVKVIKEHFWMGVGIGDAHNELMQSYESIGFLHGMNREYNSHNQYLTEILKTGIIGLILFILVLAQQWKEALQKKEVLQFIFILTSCIFFLTESVLERQMGITFFTFFTFLFSFKTDKR